MITTITKIMMMVCLTAIVPSNVRARSFATTKMITVTDSHGDHDIDYLHHVNDHINDHKDDHDNNGDQ